MSNLSYIWGADSKYEISVFLSGLVFLIWDFKKLQFYAKCAVLISGIQKVIFLLAKFFKVEFGYICVAESIYQVIFSVSALAVSDKWFCKMAVLCKMCNINFKHIKFKFSCCLRFFNYV